MRILIANDDGIYSPGIPALAKVASQFGEVRIVAPDVEQSSVGHAITHSRPLAVRPTPIHKPYEAYRVNGTPADCVALGAFLGKPVDLVLSGINLGPNIGHGIWHSGTLAAARQAVLLGIRGIAFSTPMGKTEPDWPRLTPWVHRVLELLIHDSSRSLVNVNLPPDPQGICWTRVSTRQYDGKVVPANDPYGRTLYWLAVHPIQETERETDRWAVQNGFVSVTPLRVDLTAIEDLERAKVQIPLDQETRPHELAVDVVAEEEEEASEASAG